MGFVARGEVVILPVNFAVDGQDVVFATGAGSKLSCVEVGHYVGFEADSYDTATETGWSVVVNGFAEIVDSAEEAARLDGIGMTPWGGDGRPGAGLGAHPADRGQRAAHPGRPGWQL